MNRCKKTAIVLFSLLLAGGITAAAEEVTELDWYINYSWFTSEWGEDPVSQKITEETGVSVQFQTPSGNEAEKLKMMISSGTLPDLITLGWWENQADILIQKDMVYALNKLADEYEPMFWEWAIPEAVQWYTKEDGNLYGYPCSSCVPQDYEEHDNISSNQVFMVRKDIYEAIGSPDMTTPEGFKKAVMQAAKLYPEVDGEPLIPIGADVFNEQGCTSFDKYLQNFLAVPYEKDGKYYDRYTDPDYVEWLKMFRELGEEGYLKSDIFFDQRTQTEEKLARGQYFCMLYQWTDMEAQQKILYEKFPERIYMAVDGPKNRAGDDHILAGPGINGWTLTFISKDCENPDKAIKLLAYMMSREGQRLTSLGIEGITYEEQDGENVWTPEALKLMYEDRKLYDKKYGADNTYWMLQYNIMQLDWMPRQEEAIRQLEEWTYPYTKYRAHYEVKYVPGTRAGNAAINIEHLWGRTLPQLLLAPTEEAFDRLMDSFTEERAALGYELQKQEAEKQFAYAKECLGIVSE